MRLRSKAAGSFCACTGAVLGGPKRFPRREPLAVRTATRIHVPSRPTYATAAAIRKAGSPVCTAS